VIIGCKIDIAASPEEVWSYISDPAKVMRWHCGIKAIVPVSKGAWTAGSRWRVRYEFRGRESNYLAEMLEFERPARLVVHLKGGDMPLNGYMQEVYEISTSVNGTVLKQSIVLCRYGANYFAWALAFLSHYLLRWRSRGRLLKLKELVEDIG
jgi:uncharacterized protein YndB with AHSA1/START domain